MGIGFLIKPMKIIFLDIDGVLNYQEFYAQEGRETDETWPYCDLCPKAIDILNHITDSTGAKIVISSSWRIGRPLEELQTELSKRGIKGEIIDVTPYLRFTHSSIVRGNEIHSWMMSNERLIGKYYDFEQYVILDDDSDMLYRHRDNFVHTNWLKGLTMNHAEESITILNAL